MNKEKINEAKSKIISNKDEAIEFMQRAGIYDEDGKLKEPYISDKDMNKKEQTNTVRYIDNLICDVEKVLTGLGYKVSIELNDKTKVWCVELLNANSSEAMPIRHKSMIRGLVKGYLHSFDYSCGIQKIYIYDECKGLHPEDDRYSTLEYAMSKVSDCNKNDLFVNYGTYTERYVINNNENDLFTNYGIHTDRYMIDNGENSMIESDEQSSNSPNGYGKYIDDELNKAATRYFAENTDPNKYSLADVFYHGYRCGASKKSIEGDQVDKSVKKQCVPLIGLSGKEYNEKFIENIVSGKFLTCMIDFYIFKAGEKYWFEYIGNNNYIGRSDNILNEKIHLEPRQLDYFIEIKDGDENITDVINWFYGWFYAVRTWGLTNNESNEEFCTAEAINAYKEFRDSFIIQLVTK